MKVRVNTSQGDCMQTQEIVCPFCTYQFDNSYEYGSGEEIGKIECESCGREFKAFRDIRIDYTSQPIDSDWIIGWRKGDIFEDGIRSIEDEDWANKQGGKPCVIVEAKGGIE